MSCASDGTRPPGSRSPRWIARRSWSAICRNGGASASRSTEPSSCTDLLQPSSCALACHRRQAKMTNEAPTHSVSVTGVVTDETEQVLVIQRRDNGHWEPPGGVLELGETFEQGVQREVLEETGVQVTVDRLTGVYKNMKRGIVALVYRCTIAAGNPRTSSETTSVRWVDR